jgi:hypothetical protein
MCGAGNDCRQYSRERIRADRASRRRGRRAGARRQPFRRVPARPVRRFNRRRRFAPPTDNRHRSSHALLLWGSARHHLSGPVTHTASRQCRFDGLYSRPVTLEFLAGQAHARSQRVVRMRWSTAMRRGSNPCLSLALFAPGLGFSSTTTASFENARAVCHDAPPATDDEC